MPTSKYQNRDKHLDTSGKVIGCYEREFYCFSNFSSFAVKWKGKLWPTSEHAYQAAHFLKTAPKYVERIRKMTSAHEAFKFARAHEDQAPENWHQIKLAVMEDILRGKIDQHPYVKYKLLQTGRRTIVEDSFRDPVWGWGRNRKGRNELGKIWMKLRDELKAI